MGKEPLSHFERMKMMCDYFKDQMVKDNLFIPVYHAAKAINEIIEAENDWHIRARRIEAVLFGLETSEPVNDMRWYDYRLHVNLYLNKFQ